MKIFDSTLSAIEKKLDLSVRRHAILSSNIANEETPNYIASDYSFSTEVEKAMGSDIKNLKMTSGKHLDLTTTASAHVFKDQSMPVGADGNNVDFSCGSSGLAGSCTTIPVVDCNLAITDIIGSVCSCDRLTFNNQCWAQSAGQSLSGAGECP